MKNYGKKKRNYKYQKRDSKGRFIKTQELDRKEYLKQYHKEYYKQNREKLIEYSKEWKYTETGKESVDRYNKSTKGREGDRRRSKRYRQTENGKLTALLSTQRRRERENLVINLYNKKEVENLIKNSDGYCKNCNKYIGEESLTLDHKYPIYRGYYDYLLELYNENYTALPRIYTIDDIQLLCNKCNASKGYTVSEVEC